MIASDLTERPAAKITARHEFMGLLERDGTTTFSRATMCLAGFGRTYTSEDLELVLGSLMTERVISAEGNGPDRNYKIYS